jgi:hypothetical protein
LQLLKPGAQDATVQLPLVHAPVAWAGAHAVPQPPQWSGSL